MLYDGPLAVSDMRAYECPVPCRPRRSAGAAPNDRSGSNPAGSMLLDERPESARLSQSGAMAGARTVAPNPSFATREGGWGALASLRQAAP